MTTMMPAEMLKMVDKAATYITNLNGESESFKVENFITVY